MKKNALIVDDLKFARQIIKEVLTSARFNVVGEADNGQDAILQYKTLKPDFVIMDVVMPLKGGIEATRSILEHDKEAKIIILTAMCQEQLMMEAVNAGARDYILKPFESKDLIQAVQKLFLERDFSKIAKGAASGS